MGPQQARCAGKGEETSQNHEALLRDRVATMAFSPLQEISRSKRDPRVMARELRDAKAHVKFCLEIYSMQLAEK